MSVRERVLVSRLIEKIRTNPEYAEFIGVTAIEVNNTPIEDESRSSN